MIYFSRKSLYIPLKTICFDLKQKQVSELSTTGDQSFMVQQPIGYYIRQLRRGSNLTQTQLGGDRFSKSYVSAVERGKIEPSLAALQFFAEQLAQPADYFLQLAEKSQNNRSLLLLDTPATPGAIPEEVPAFLNEELALLDALLEQARFHNVPVQSQPFKPSPEMLAQLPPSKRARYHFLSGLLAQRNEEYHASVEALEAALAGSDGKYRLVVLDELGNSYALLHAYQSALSYHLRALHTLEQEPPETVSPGLRFLLELHCGNDYLALGDYQSACDHFECARGYLHLHQDMKSAALLYWGLGYCMYALAYQQAFLSLPSLPAGGSSSPDAIDRQYQQAISYLLQSRSVYQIAGDSLEEVQVRLLLAQVMLDLCAWRKRLAREKAKRNGKRFHVNIASLLDDAAEQCQQILMSLQAQVRNIASSTAEHSSAIVQALAYLVRIGLQRAALAREGSYAGTALRERSVATYICYQALKALTEGTLPEQLIRNAGNVREDPMVLQYTSLPSLPIETDLAGNGICSPKGWSEIYFAAGKVAEEFGRAAETPEFADYCYTQANKYFHAALIWAEATHTRQGREPGYLVRAYQRCIAILEERMQVVPEHLSSSQVLLDTLKCGLLQLQSLFFLVQKEGDWSKFPILS